MTDAIFTKFCFNTISPIKIGILTTPISACLSAYLLTVISADPAARILMRQIALYTDPRKRSSFAASPGT